MYKVTRKGKTLPASLRKTFKSYDEARKAVRAWLYALFKKQPKLRRTIDVRNRTATIGLYGFSIGTI
jgi:hypothetical protein